MLAFTIKALVMFSLRHTHTKSLSRSVLDLLVSRVSSSQLPATSYRLPGSWREVPPPGPSPAPLNPNLGWGYGIFFNAAKQTRSPPCGGACVIALCLHLSAINFVNECIIAFLCTPRGHLGPRPPEIIAKEFK